MKSRICDPVVEGENINNQEALACVKAFLFLGSESMFGFNVLQDVFKEIETPFLSPYGGCWISWILLIMLVSSRRSVSPTTI